VLGAFSLAFGLAGAAMLIWKMAIE